MPEDAFDLIILFDQCFKCYKVEAGERAAVTKVIRLHSHEIASRY